MPDNDPYADRKKLTFEQAEGVDPLPTQLLLKEVSQELRALLWKVLYVYMTKNAFDEVLDEKWYNILYDYHVYREHLMADDFDNRLAFHAYKWKLVFSTGNYIKIFGFLQFVLRHRYKPYEFSEQIDAALLRGRAAYRVLGGRTIIPVG